MGLEPTRLAATDFESAVSAYSIHFSINGDAYGNRTRVTAVKGRCLDLLTNAPCGAGEGNCTLDRGKEVNPRPRPIIAPAYRKAGIILPRLHHRQNPHLGDFQRPRRILALGP